MTHGDNCEINLAIFPPWPGRSQQTDVEHKELPFPGAEPEAAAEDAEPGAEPGAFTAAEASGDDGDEPMRSGAGTSWIPKSRNCHQNCWVIVMSYEQKASLRERERPIWGMSGKCQQASILSQRPNTELSHCGLTWSQFLSILIFQISMVWILDTWSSKFFSSDVRNTSWHAYRTHPCLYICTQM